MRQTHSSWVGVLAGTDELEDGYHGEGHVPRSALRTIGAESKVDVDKSRCVSLEPSGLEGYGTTSDGPFRAVSGGGMSTTCEGVSC